MNAAEANKLTLDSIEQNSAKNDAAAQRIVEVIKAKIAEAAKAGQFTVHDPLHGVRLHTNHQERLRAYNILHSEGYQVTCIPNGVTTVAWG